MASDQILKIIGGGDTLRFGGTQKVLLDRVRIVSKRDLDWTLKAVDVSVVAGTLICLVLLHQWNELLGGPALGLEVIVIRSRCSSVHLTNIRPMLHIFKVPTYHEVDGRSSSEDMCARHYSSSSIKPFRRSRVVEGGSLAVQLHVPRVDTWTENPWVVQVVFSALNQEDLEIVIQIRQSTRDYASTRPSTTHDDINLGMLDIL